MYVQTTAAPQKNAFLKCKLLHYNLKALPLLVVLWSIAATTSTGQPLGNEWIDYSKQYYKIPITTASPTGRTAGNQLDKGDYSKFYRITYAILDSLHLTNTPAEDFQMWRNGVEVPLYITKPAGPLAANDYIEFWGEANDGKPDKQLFRDSTFQTNDRWSFFSDTAYHFLTVNPGAKNARITDIANNPLLSSLVPDAYFMHTLRINYRQYRYLGYGFEISGQAVRSSSFDMGEGWGNLLYRNTNIAAGVNLNYTPLNEYKDGPLMTLKYAVSGETDLTRDITVTMRNTFGPYVKDSVVDTKRFRRYVPAEYTVNNIPYSRIINNKPQGVEILYNFSTGPNDNGDKVYILRTELTYAHTFNFSTSATTSENYFLFSLPASAAGNLFNALAPGLGSFVPYIVDLTNHKRFFGVKKDNAANTYAFELEPSATERKLVFVGGNTKGVNYNEILDTSATKTSSKLSVVKFKDFASPANHADYIIISNNKLFNAAGVNYVDQYKEYRNTKEGGSFNAKVYEIDSLTDQFAYGIKGSPLAVRNFIRYAKATFAEPVKYVFIIGRGVTYEAYDNQTLGLGNGGNIRSSATLEALNLVPTWGQPASDNLLVAADDNKSSTPTIPIGRLAVVNGFEVQNYLDKVKEYELLQSTPEGSAWQKNAIHLVGGSDTTIVKYIKGNMDSYKTILEDTLAGAKVNTYVRINDPNTAANNLAIQKQVSEGTGLVTYFGHSSPTSIDFSLNDPNELGNTGGKYPVFLFNGCNASEFFTGAGIRLNGVGLTLSEKFVLAKEKGNIAFMSSSHFGILQYLAPFTTEWYKAAGRTKYGKGLGEIMQETIRSINNLKGLSDPYNRVTTEEYILHGDPAVKLYSIIKPDYAVDSTSIVFTPSHVTMATDSVDITTTLYNHGKAVGDSVWFQLDRTLPDGKTQTVYSKKIASFGYSTSVSVKVAIVGVNEKGQNYFRAVIDSANIIDEVEETNNATTKPLFIYDNEVVPVVPYQYSIIHNTQQPIKFIGSTVNPLAQSVSYRLQLDTTTAFNSVLLQTKDTTVSGGIVEFSQSLQALPDSTVYYWRLSPITAGIASNWTNSSFTYLSGSTDGFNQSHYYQHLNSSYTNIKLDAASRKFQFDSTHNHIYIDQGIYRTSGTESVQFSLAANGSIISQAACIGRSIIFNVFDSLSFEPWQNTPAPNGRFGSTNSNCATTAQYNFEFSYSPASNRKKIMDFLDSIPKGMFVAVRLNLDPDPGQPGFPIGKADSSYAAYWQNDTTFFGSGKSLYHSFLKQGFYGINDLNIPRTFGVVFKKDDTLTFRPQYKLSDGLYDRATLGVLLPMQDTGGIISSPLFGPATAWHELHWRNKSITSPSFDDGGSDSVTIHIFGVDTAGVETKLKTFGKSIQDTSIADINAAIYPYLRLQMINNDPKNGTPQQLDYWRLNYDPIPEGAIAPSDYYNFTKNRLTGAYKDTLDKGIDTLHFGVAFKNISTAEFKDSIAVQVLLTDSAGNTSIIPVNRLKPLVVNDTIHVDLELLTGSLQGAYTLFVNFNPNKLQVEEMTNNNFMYKSFYVDALPDGAIDSAGYFDFTKNTSTNTFKDTLTIGKDLLHFGIAFKNISPFEFKDSISAKLSLQADGGTAVALPQQLLKPLVAGDTLHVNYDAATDTLQEGWHTISTIFNADMAKQERTLANNSFSHRFYMTAAKDTTSFFSFTAVLKGDSVLLAWTATNEINYDNYTVEYSTNNQTFSPLGSFESQHTNAPFSYAYTHNGPVTLPDTNYYRIKITRNNGSVLYSNTRIIIIQAAINPITEFKVRVVPNPFHEKLIVYVENPDNTVAVPAILVNTLGQVMRRLNLQAYNNINTSMLPGGSYWLIVFKGNEKIPFKLEKQ